MVPVTVLQIEHHHRVLDMCAAPGSKTRQALDAMLTHAHAHAPRRIKGFVLANDCDPKRAYVLAHQSRALGVHTQRLLISCHKAQKLPLVAHDPELHGFDRIICDVPCSGDGTIRKAPEVWHRWHPDFGLELHRLQLQIAMRGVALLRLGGLMCYSTCSFNPIEDEAVVSEILARFVASRLSLVVVVVVVCVVALIVVAVCIACMCVCVRMHQMCWLGRVGRHNRPRQDDRLPARSDELARDDRRPAAALVLARAPPDQDQHQEAPPRPPPECQHVATAPYWSLEATRRADTLRAPLPSSWRWWRLLRGLAAQDRSSRALSSVCLEQLAGVADT